MHRHAAELAVTSVGDERAEFRTIAEATPQQLALGQPEFGAALVCGIAMDC